jgi:hypothetical protein
MSVGIGEPVPQFRLDDVEGLPHGLDRSPATIVVFTSLAADDAWHDRIAQLADDYEIAGAHFLVINPVDGVEDVLAWLSSRVWPLPYLLDSTQSVARSFGARTTTEAFVLDLDSVLRYRGAPGAELAEAIDRVLENEDVDVAETEPTGPAIEWRS